MKSNKKNHQVSNEFFLQEEYNTFDEFKIFDAEDYIFNKEIHLEMTEQFDTEEIKNVATEQKIKTKTKLIESSTLEQAKNSVTTTAIQAGGSTVITATSTIAATTVGVVAAVTLLPAIVSRTPKIDINDYLINSNYVYYDVSISSLSENIDYDILLYNSTESYEYDDVSEGRNYVEFFDLNSFTYYTLAFVDRENNITYYEKSFYTLKDTIEFVNVAEPQIIDGRILLDIHLDLSQIYIENKKYYLTCEKNGEIFHIVPLENSIVDERIELFDYESFDIRVYSQNVENHEKMAHRDFAFLEGARIVYEYHYMFDEQNIHSSIGVQYLECYYEDGVLLAKAYLRVLLGNSSYSYQIAAETEELSKDVFIFLVAPEINSFDVNIYNKNTLVETTNVIVDASSMQEFKDRELTTEDYELTKIENNQYRFSYYAKEYSTDLVQYEVFVNENKYIPVNNQIILENISLRDSIYINTYITKENTRCLIETCHAYIDKAPDADYSIDYVEPEDYTITLNTDGSMNLYLLPEFEIYSSEYEEIKVNVELISNNEIIKEKIVYGDIAHEVVAFEEIPLDRYKIRYTVYGDSDILSQYETESVELEKISNSCIEGIYVDKTTGKVLLNIAIEGEKEIYCRETEESYSLDEKTNEFTLEDSEKESYTFEITILQNIYENRSYGRIENYYTIKGSAIYEINKEVVGTITKDLPEVIRIEEDEILVTYKEGKYNVYYQVENSLEGNYKYVVEYQEQRYEFLDEKIHIEDCDIEDSFIIKEYKISEEEKELTRILNVSYDKNREISYEATIENGIITLIPDTDAFMDTLEINLITTDTSTKISVNKTDLVDGIFRIETELSDIIRVDVDTKFVLNSINISSFEQAGFSIIGEDYIIEHSQIQPTISYNLTNISEEDHVLTINENSINIYLLPEFKVSSTSYDRVYLDIILKKNEEVITTSKIDANASSAIPFEEIENANYHIEYVIYAVKDVDVIEINKYFASISAFEKYTNDIIKGVSLNRQNGIVTIEEEESLVISKEIRTNTDEVFELETEENTFRLDSPLYDYYEFEISYTLAVYENKNLENLQSMISIKGDSTYIVNKIITIGAYVEDVFSLEMDSNNSSVTATFTFYEFDESTEYTYDITLYSNSNEIKTVSGVSLKNNSMKYSFTALDLDDFKDKTMSLEYSVYKNGILEDTFKKEVYYLPQVELKDNYTLLKTEDGKIEATIEFDILKDAKTKLFINEDEIVERNILKNLVEGENEIHILVMRNEDEVSEISISIDIPAISTASFDEIPEVSIIVTKTAEGLNAYCDLYDTTENIVYIIEHGNEVEEVESPQICVSNCAIWDSFIIKKCILQNEKRIVTDVYSAEIDKRIEINYSPIMENGVLQLTPVLSNPRYSFEYIDVVIQGSKTETIRFKKEDLTGLNYDTFIYKTDIYDSEVTISICCNVALNMEMMLNPNITYEGEFYQEIIHREVVTASISDFISFDNVRITKDDTSPQSVLMDIDCDIRYYCESEGYKFIVKLIQKSYDGSADEEIYSMNLADLEHLPLGVSFNGKNLKLLGKVYDETLDDYVEKIVGGYEYVLQYLLVDSESEEIIPQEEIRITYDSSTNSPEYSMLYLEPNDITYDLNEDGTYNAYIFTKFSSTMLANYDKLYYRIELIQNDSVIHFVEGQSSFAQFYNLRDTYTIKYFIYGIQNDIAYSIYQTSSRKLLTPVYVEPSISIDDTLHTGKITFDSQVITDIKLEIIYEDSTTQTIIIPNEDVVYNSGYITSFVLSNENSLVQQIQMEFGMYSGAYYEELMDYGCEFIGSKYLYYELEDAEFEITNLLRVIDYEYVENDQNGTYDLTITLVDSAEYVVEFYGGENIGFSFVREDTEYDFETGYRTYTVNINPLRYTGEYSLKLYFLDVTGSKIESTEKIYQIPINKGE